MIDRNQFVNLVQRGEFEALAQYVENALRDVSTVESFDALCEALQGQKEDSLQSDEVIFSLQVEDVEFVFVATKADKDVDDLLRVCCIADRDDGSGNGHCDRVLEVDCEFYDDYFDWLIKVYVPKLRSEIEGKLQRIARSATKESIAADIEKMLSNEFAFASDLDKDAIVYVLDNIGYGRLNQRADSCVFVGDLDLNLGSGSAVTLRVRAVRGYLFGDRDVHFDVTLHDDEDE